jgi:hypothetical protein
MARCILMALGCATSVPDDSAPSSDITSLTGNLPLGAAILHIHTSIPAKHLDQTTKTPAKAMSLRLML